STIAQTLGVPGTGRETVEERLKEYLREKQMLLLLDNFEQVLAAAPLVADLLATAPGLKVLVTSRAALHLRGEQEFPVPPLALPARQQTLRDAIAWSYDLLSEAEKCLFRRLSVFVGGCTLEAVEAVCSDSALSPTGPAIQNAGALDGLEALVSQSLLRPEEP